MKKNKKDPLFNQKVQDELNKLISEEMLAYMSYHNAILMMDPLEACKILEMFKTISEDEILDHHKELCKFAIENGYEIPVQEKDYKKYAGESCWKLYDSMKKNQDAKYYIDLAIEMEKDAILSYQKSLQVEDIPYELHATLQKNYYDEIEHLEDLATLQSAEEACADLVWTNSNETANMLGNIYWW